MRITSIETIAVNVPLNPARAIKAHGMHHRESPFLFIMVHTSEGVTGLGEVSCTPAWSGEDHFTARRFIETLIAPAIIGHDPTRITQTMDLIHGVLAGNPFTKAGIEMALWDILGKVAGLPLYQLLGGPVRDEVPTKFSVSGLQPALAAKIASWAVEQGFSTIKVKVGLNPEEDIARISEVRSAVGPNVRIGVDANGGWDVRTAIRCIRKMEDSNIYFAEQPVGPLDPSWMADVRKSVAVPIIADESVYTAQDAMKLAKVGAADVFSAYVGKGGFGPAREVASVAGAAGLCCTVGSNLELGIGAAAMIHFAMATAAVNAEEFPCDILTPFYYETDLLLEPLNIQAGSAKPPLGFGLGVELDMKAVERYKV